MTITRVLILQCDGDDCPATTRIKGYVSETSTLKVGPTDDGLRRQAAKKGWVRLPDPVIDGASLDLCQKCARAVKRLRGQEPSS